MTTIDRHLARLQNLGFDLVLSSGNAIRYIPMTHTLMNQPELKQNEDLVIYWDGFKEFRAKGGSVGGMYFAVLKEGLSKWKTFD